MPLTEAQKHKIEEEEKYRAKVKANLAEENISSDGSQKKKGTGCFTKILFLFGLIFIVSVIGSGFGTGKTENKPNPPPTQEEDTLKGKVSFDDAQFKITNQDIKDWEACTFILNNKYYYPTKISWLPGDKIEVIKIGTELTIGSANFTLKDGTRFNTFAMKPLTLSLGCDNGFTTWSW